MKTLYEHFKDWLNRHPEGEDGHIVGDREASESCPLAVFFNRMLKVDAIVSAESIGFVMSDPEMEWEGGIGFEFNTAPWMKYFVEEVDSGRSIEGTLSDGFNVTAEEARSIVAEWDRIVAATPSEWLPHVRRSG